MQAELPLAANDPAWHCWQVPADVAPAISPYAPALHTVQAVAKENGITVRYIVAETVMVGNVVTAQVTMFIFLTCAVDCSKKQIVGSLVDALMPLGSFSCAFVPIPSVEALIPFPTTVCTANDVMLIVLITLLSVYAILC